MRQRVCCPVGCPICCPICCPVCCQSAARSVAPSADTGQMDHGPCGAVLALHAHVTKGMFGLARPKLRRGEGQNRLLGFRDQSEAPFRTAVPLPIPGPQPPPSASAPGASRLRTAPRSRGATRVPGQRRSCAGCCLRNGHPRDKAGRGDLHFLRFLGRQPRKASSRPLRTAVADGKAGVNVLDKLVPGPSHRARPPCPRWRSSCRRAARRSTSAGP